MSPLFQGKIITGSSVDKVVHFHVENDVLKVVGVKPRFLHKFFEMSFALFQNFKDLHFVKPELHAFFLLFVGIDAHCFKDVFGRELSLIHI